MKPKYSLQSLRIYLRNFSEYFDTSKNYFIASSGKGNIITINNLSSEIQKKVSNDENYAKQFLEWISKLVLFLFDIPKTETRHITYHHSYLAHYY